MVLGCGFFLIVCFYGLLEFFFDHSWKLNDIEKL